MKTRFTEKKLASLTRQELYTLARELDIAGRSSLSRQELIKVLQLLLVEPPVSRGLKKAPILPAIVKSQEQPGQTYTRDSSTEEAPPPKRGRGRPPKKTAVESPAPAVLSEPSAPEKSAERPRRGRPPKAAKKEPLTEKPEQNSEDRPRRGRPPKVKNDVVPAEKPRRGRPPKARPVALPEAAPLPAAAAAGPMTLHVPEAVSRQCEEEAAAMRTLNRAFGKKSSEAQVSANKKGASVIEPAVAIPVNLAHDERKTSDLAEKIESDRRRRHASLKTTMEIPVLSTSSATSAAPVSESELTGDLPEYYDETRLVLQIRDPHWAYAYWELPPVERKRLELEVGIFEFAHSHYILRLHNVTRGHTQEIKLTENARNWYIYLEDAKCVYQVELGLQSPTEGYTFIALSNLVQTPPDRAAEHWAAPVAPQPILQILSQTDEQSEVPPEPESVPPAPLAARLTDPAFVYYQSLSGDPVLPAGSSEIPAGLNAPAPQMPGSHAGLPAGISSLSLPGSFTVPTSASEFSSMPGSLQMPGSAGVSSFDQVRREKSAPSIALAADLVLYGQVPEGCDLFFMGQQVTARTDGTFSLRLALPANKSCQLELVAVNRETGETQKIAAHFAFNR
ncbi:hypothetical protein MASR1M12_16180 [Erysipelotrichia bacterium]